MSLLLQAPAEIRNCILEYVLTGQTLRFLGLSPVDEQPVLINTSTHKPFNALKYTCKQLLYESRGLELQDNIIVFHQRDEEDSTPDVQLKLFCKHIPLTRISQIRAVKVRPKVEEFSGEYILQIVRACRSVLPPGIGIYYSIWHFRLSPARPTSRDPMPCDAAPFFWLGLAIQIALKRRILAEVDWASRRFERTWGEVWSLANWIAMESCHDMSVAREELDGVRFMPEENLVTWQAMGEEGMRRLGSEKGVGEDVVEEWVELGRRWVEEGI